VSLGEAVDITRQWAGRVVSAMASSGAKQTRLIVHRSPGSARGASVAVASLSASWSASCRHSGRLRCAGNV